VFSNLSQINIVTRDTDTGYLPVHLSITLWNCVQMNTHSIRIFTLCAS